MNLHSPLRIPQPSLYQIFSSLLTDLLASTLSPLFQSCLSMITTWICALKYSRGFINVSLYPVVCKALSIICLLTLPFPTTFHTNAPHMSVLTIKPALLSFMSACFLFFCYPWHTSSQWPRAFHVTCTVLKPWYPQTPIIHTSVLWAMSSDYDSSAKEDSKAQEVKQHASGSSSGMW